MTMILIILQLKRNREQKIAMRHNVKSEMGQGI